MAVKVLNPAMHQHKKASILEHARHLFATQGYAETSMDSIAQSGHMQKASLYHYFASKQQILQEMINWELERWWSARLVDYARGQTLTETLTLIATSFLQDMDNPIRQEFFQISYFESDKNPVIYKAIKESPMYNRSGLYTIFARHLEPCPAPKVGMFMTQFMGALIHYAVLTKLRKRDLGWGLPDDGAYVRQLVEFFAGGLAGTHPLQPPLN
jgi:AcrR family transcriptional regulator